MAIIDYLKENLSEAVTPKLPKGVKYGSRQVNKGTMMEFTDKTAKFTTSQGNNVAVHIFPDGSDYEIAFDVNGDRKETSRDRDPEILSGVLAVALKAVDKFKIDRLKIKADNDPRDVKVKKNIPMEDFEDKYKDIISKVLHELNNLDFTGEEPSDAIAKLNQKRGTTYDPNARLNSTIKDLKLALDGRPIYPQHISGLSYFPKEYVDEFNSVVTEYNKRKQSYSDEGVKEIRNRRYEIYRRLIPKYFQGWDITFEDRFDTIYLERKKEEN